MRAFGDGSCHIQTLGGALALPTIALGRQTVNALLMDLVADCRHAVQALIYQTAVEVESYDQECQHLLAQLQSITPPKSTIPIESTTTLDTQYTIDLTLVTGADQPQGLTLTRPEDLFIHDIQPSCPSLTQQRILTLQHYIIHLEQYEFDHLVDSVKHLSQGPILEELN